MVKSFIILLLVGYAYAQGKSCGTTTPDKPYEIGYGSERWDLILMNGAMRKLLEAELKELTTCMKNELKCETGLQYPDCLDQADGDNKKYSSTIKVEDFFVFQVLGLTNALKGDITLKDAYFNGMANFDIDHIESTVTIVPLGIEFSFTLQWNGDNNFHGDYDVSDLKSDTLNGVIIKGNGPMSVTSNKIGFEFRAHKILGGKMDYLKITPTVDAFEVTMKELCYGGQDMHELAHSKFNKDYIECKIKYPQLSGIIMKFFNDNLYPTPSSRSYALPPNHIMSKIGKCIHDKFPQ